MEMPGGDQSIPRLQGHSTKDALRILHEELQSVISSYETSRRLQSYTKKWRQCFLHHSKRHSPLHWTSCAIILGLALLLIIAFAASEGRDHWLLIQALLLLFGLVINIYAIGLDEKLRENEMIDRTKNVLNTIKACSEGPVWEPHHFVSLHAPLAPSVSLQWTYRDSNVVNLPCAFLVEGDVILLRPGQEVPAKCRTLELLANGTVQELKAGDVFNPDAGSPEPESFSLPEAREPKRPCPFIMLETPFSQNLKLMLNRACQRPVSVINNERYMVYSVWVERRIMPAVLAVSLISNVLRYLLGDGVGHWSEMLIVLQVEALLPLTALVLPILWRALDFYGIAKILIVFKKLRNNNVHVEMDYTGDFGSDSSIHIPSNITWTWRELFCEMCKVMAGLVPTLPRTSNIVHDLGNVTSFCCVDKKGILSWPNPTAEKVFFLRNDLGSRDKQWDSTNTSIDADSGSVHLDSFDEEFKSISAKNILRHDHDLPLETNFEVLDLTPDAKNCYKLHFDDPSWKKYLSSLKPLLSVYQQPKVKTANGTRHFCAVSEVAVLVELILGLNILLNTCNLATVNKYTEFADHVTCSTLKREEAAPVLNRRCFCELARQIGFSSQALEIFKLHQVLGMYRHLPSQSHVKNNPLPGNKSVMKYKMPIPNMFSVVAKEINTGMSQLMSQGTGDMLLDACSDYWDGHDLCTLTEVDRKKITDFYQRTSMSSYCTAFSYRPLTQSLGTEFRDLYLEIPEVHNHLYPQVHSPTPTKSWDTESLDSRLQSGKARYHCSMDSLLVNMDSNSIHDIDGAFRVQCNQVFIGMITMQYQAKQEVVKLIEDLESACIRFVHFSKENELRSRVFSEKMGLEAGWNCHISLLGEKVPDQEEAEAALTATTAPGPPSSLPVAATLTTVLPATACKPMTALTVSANKTSANSLQRPRSKHSSDSLRLRRGSAPGAINLEVTQVKFESDPPGVSLVMQPSSDTSPSVSRSSMTSLTADHTRGANHIWSKLSDESSKKCSQDRHDVPGTARELPDEDHDITDPLLRMCPDSPPTAPLSEQAASDVDETKVELLEQRSVTAETPHSDNNDNLSTSESYPASSHFTENTDSVTIGFSNRAKLPKGIENIRPHLDNVDNVPLLVSLFTDCTPQTTQEMTSILQEYGEVVCCLGSSANIHNTGVFLQADCSVALEPLYPHVCMCEHPVGANWTEPSPGPLELSNMLHSLPCALSFRHSDKISAMQLVAQARHHVQGMRHTFLLLLMLQLSLVALQLFSYMLLPPPLAPHHISWLAVFVLPALCLTMSANPLDPDIMKKALGKNIDHLSPQVVVEFLFYFGAGCVPTIVICLICHAINLNMFCRKVATPLNVTCHLLYGSSALAAGPGQWNGWTTELSAGLALSQNLVAFQFLLYAGCASLSFIHRYKHLWQQSPFANRVWCVTMPVLLVLQLVYCIADIGIHNSLSQQVFEVTDIPVPTVVIAFLWPIILIAIQELIKRRERKLSVRYQKRARLDFGTKLGMNSPF